MAATTPPDLPLWAWNLIIALDGYEDQHSSTHTCLRRVLTAVPADVRSQAQAISGYIRQADGNVIADKAARTWDDIAAAFFGAKPETAGGYSRAEDGE